MVSAPILKPEFLKRLPVVPRGQWAEQYKFLSNYYPIEAGRAIHYLDVGSGPPVVMVHGNPGWSFMWRSLVSGLTGYRRLALDLMGMGLSSRPGPGPWYSLSGRILDFSSWLDSLDLTEPIHLIVHDWGGPIALGWAANNPEKVASLTLMNTAVRLPHGAKISNKLLLFKKTLFLGRLLCVNLNLFVRGLVRYGTVRPMTQATIEGLLAPYRTKDHREAVGAFIKDIPLSPSHPSYAALANLDRNLSRLSTKPTELIWGLKDFVFTPIFMRDLAERFKAPELWGLKTSGHCLTEDQPGHICDIVLDFLRRNS